MIFQGKEFLSMILFPNEIRDFCQAVRFSVLDQIAAFQSGTGNVCLKQREMRGLVFSIFHAPLLIYIIVRYKNNIRIIQNVEFKNNPY